MTTIEALPPGSDASALYRAHESSLRGLAYRLTGSTADADDVVQETFARFLDRGPDLAGPALRAWLVRVATNFGIDTLRRRRRRHYPGPWLPSPAEGPDDDPLAALVSPEPDPEARYEMLESASFAFLVALEALGPRQRAALLLRDVLSYSAAEAADCLGINEGNLRVLHLRARRTLAAYDREPCRPTRELRARHREALERLLGCLVSQDENALAALLSESVRTVTDAGGEYTALAVALEGRARVARFYLRATLHRQAGGPQFEVRHVNGLPAAVISLARPVRRQAPRSVILLELDAGGRIRTLHTVLAPRKLGDVRFPSSLPGPL